jgi:RES domain-containing protein
VRIYRITKTEYIDDFSGEGARLYGGRWNLVGDPVIYFSQNLSLSLLEIIVHVEFAKLPMGYSFIEAEIPDEFIKPIKSLDFIKPKWSSEGAEKQVQMLGTTWLKRQESLALRVPSAILGLEHNILINPTHKDIESIKIIKKQSLDFDPRLIR